MKKSHKTILLWLLLILMFVAIFQVMKEPQDGAKWVSFSQLLDEVHRGTIRDVRVTLQGNGQAGEFRASDEQGHTYRATGVLSDSVLGALEQERVNLRVRVEASGPWSSLLVTWLPVAFLLVLFFLFLRRLQSGKSTNVDELGRAPLTGPLEAKERFSDVAEAPGVAGAKEALQRQVAVLARSEGPAPLACLLTGPPGCGKSLLGRALAAESGRPVLAQPATGFIHMFVGIGASRVRDLFKRARESAPCIVFIDELDALAKVRTIQTSSERHDEREQALQQLLVELDQVRDQKQRILVVAATNRPDLIDPAFVDGGRFAQRLELPLPDRAGRRAILGLLATDVGRGRLAADVDLDRLAADTEGCSGGELRGLLSDAVSRAAAGAAVSAAEIEQALRASPRYSQRPAR